jgi:hypothetical protein
MGAELLRRADDNPRLSGIFFNVQDAVGPTAKMAVLQRKLSNGQKASHNGLSHLPSALCRHDVEAGTPRQSGATTSNYPEK